ncbi:calmodulin-like protein, putative [Bodo saltans]|uniref:Calmodulin-like protein, putative n=1 Tax=Bodo saltans TaxID=75058 RepID=A0A0S4JPW5_BODSA|nr:calmodulin-like protein, putative [Bodo saltans]|eukprot:CUG92220.1 calmodulin-like protein, putative [Bodo saltans]
MQQNHKSARPPQSNRPAAGGSTTKNASVLFRAGSNNANALATSPSGPLPVLTHSCLSPAQVAKAHAVFLSYCDFDDDLQHLQGGVGGTASATVSPSPALSAAPSMSPKGVQRFLGDLGIIKTESEAKDTIFTLNQSAAIVHRNKKIDDRTGLSSGGAGSVMSGRTTGTEDTVYSSSAATGATGKGGAAGQTLSFPLFLELLTTTFPEQVNGVSKDEELRQTFETLDANSDGVLTPTDMITLVKTLLQDNPGNPDLRAIDSMTLEQLRAAMDEADLDGDGRVTLEDFVKILTTA